MHDSKLGNPTTEISVQVNRQTTTANDSAVYWLIEVHQCINGKERCRWCQGNGMGRSGCFQKRL